ncbi:MULTISPECIES: NAD-dependent epimerase/dehydratase family protein [Pseudomonas]|uniref:NAD-dependent epimerase/dehydratase family protein n=1 Tax=Pseudomonas azadiae TaxID=2843612 RepID=A0ABS6P227_9PSED|nr:NAD-dependent epimerase/dehydratase family protein [Pseudomonas azadiae]MBV4454522.1 NAD-dependent epimerase/dehydratase family protein [Pseudomonas azadiae]NMF39678.1 NAD-dependent epimerase/dehydratase family protein [Pseudomonas sp. SWRI 103]
MNVCITGGTGFIGSPLCALLLSQGDRVRMLSRREQPAMPGREVFAGDLLQPYDALGGFLEGCNLLYHCAGEINDTDLMYDLHVRGTANLLKAVSEKIKLTGEAFHWVQLSSTGAYGKRTLSRPEAAVSIDETFSPAPVGEYEVTKTISDELVISYSKIEPLFSYTIIRPSIVVGPQMPNQSFFQLSAMVRKRLFFYIGSKKAVSTYVHVDDVVRALVMCASDVRAKGQIFILSNDCLLSDVIDSMADAYNVSRPTLRVPVGIVRLLVGIASPFVRLPLTDDRVNELVKEVGYSSAKIEETIGFKYQAPIPKVMPALLSQYVKKSNLKIVANND